MGDGQENRSEGEEIKIVCLPGSPRPGGNSSTIARHFLKTAEGLGAETRTFELNRLAFRGCQGCYACKMRTDRCVVQDDLTKVLDAVSGADLLLLATRDSRGTRPVPAAGGGNGAQGHSVKIR